MRFLNLELGTSHPLPTLRYYRRIVSAYLLGGKSHLTFWHETPTENSQANTIELGEYYMVFAEKADYQGAYDAVGVPRLDYHGHIGLQYNPIAIAQYGLGNYNLWRRTNDPARKQKFLEIADWLCAHLEPNAQGVDVWNHHFNWEYRDTLRAPWYSGLAQGQGISLLVRAHHDTNDSRYLDVARKAYQSFLHPTAQGGVVFRDEQHNLWIEEYLVDPPTHILNGFIWALWGIHDYFLTTKEKDASDLFARFVNTIALNLERYDLGFWSLYEQSGTRLKMIASPFYHQLHIVQLRILQQMTGNKFFSKVADRWEAYSRSRAKRAAALCYKSAFKLCYY